MLNHLLVSTMLWQWGWCGTCISDYCSVPQLLSFSLFLDQSHFFTIFWKRFTIPITNTTSTSITTTTTIMGKRANRIGSSLVLNEVHTIQVHHNRMHGNLTKWCVGGGSPTCAGSEKGHSNKSGLGFVVANIWLLLTCHQEEEDNCSHEDHDKTRNKKGPSPERKAHRDTLELCSGMSQCSRHADHSPWPSLFSPYCWYNCAQYIAYGGVCIPYSQHQSPVLFTKPVPIHCCQAWPPCGLCGRRREKRK